MKEGLGLSFAVLCDTRREVVTKWGLLNRREMGGIAYPAVFAVDLNLTVRFRSLDRTARRAEPAAVREIVKIVARGAISVPAQPELRKVRPGAMFPARVAQRHPPRRSHLLRRVIAFPGAYSQGEWGLTRSDSATAGCTTLPS